MPRLAGRRLQQRPRCQPRTPNVSFSSSARGLWPYPLTTSIARFRVAPLPGADPQQRYGVRIRHAGIFGRWNHNHNPKVRRVPELKTSARLGADPPIRGPRKRPSVGRPPTPSSRSASSSRGTLLIGLTPLHAPANPAHAKLTLSSCAFNEKVMSPQSARRICYATCGARVFG